MHMQMMGFPKKNCYSDKEKNNQSEPPYVPEDKT